MNTDEETHILKNAACSFIKTETFMFHPIMKLFMPLIPGSVLLLSAYAEEENTGALQIESTTDELSADIHIAREEGKEPPRSEADDKKRTKLGIGESADLFLTGKESLIGNIQKIKWAILEGKDLGELSEEAGQPVKLQLSPYSTQGGTLVVQATTEHNTTVKKEFTVVVPKVDTEGRQQVTAQHFKHPETGKRGYDAWNSEAVPTQTGCSAKLEITLYPTDVNFHRVEILETHLEDIPDPLPEIADKHNPLPIGCDVNKCNVFIDNIGSPKPMSRCKNLPQEWTWVSKFSTSRLSAPLLDITTQRQHFQFTWSAPNEEGVTIKITKFGRGVQRTAIKPPYYTPKRKPETLTLFL